MRQPGFTLPELMIGLALAWLLAAMALPSFGRLVQEERLAGETSGLVLALNLARAEAARRRRTVSLCPSSNGTSCNGGSSWEAGYIVFVNEDADVPPAVDPGEEVVRVINPAARNVTVRADAFATFISFGPDTFGNAPGSFTLCDQRGASAAQGVLVNTVGRPRRAQDTDGDGIEEDRNGNALSC